MDNTFNSGSKFVAIITTASEIGFNMLELSVVDTGLLKQDKSAEAQVWQTVFSRNDYDKKIEFIRQRFGPDLIISDQSSKIKT